MYMLNNSERRLVYGMFAVAGKHIQTVAWERIIEIVSRVEASFANSCLQ